MQWDGVTWLGPVRSVNLTGWPATSWIQEFEHRTGDVSGGADPFGLALNGAFFSAAWIILCVLDGAARTRQFTLRGLLALMLCVAIMLGAYLTACAHNRQVAGRAAAVKDSSTLPTTHEWEARQQGRRIGRL